MPKIYQTYQGGVVNVLFLIMVAVALGLALPLTGYWFYDAMREKSVKLRVLTGFAFMGNLVGFLYLVLLLWAVMHISV